VPPGHPPIAGTALVTGASAGIGRELVRRLVLDRGWYVVATARRADRLEALAAELPPGSVEPIPGDLADPAFRARLWAAADDRPGGCDLLVNNAGLGHYDRLADAPPAPLDAMIEVNLTALVDLTRMALASMLPRRRGQVVQVASVLSFFGLPYSATYVATKHAVLGLVRSLEYETRGTGVRVWATCPGRTESEFASVAAGRGPGTLPHRRAEPTERVARGILRGLDRRGTVLFPTPAAWATARAATWLGPAFRAFMTRWAPAHFESEHDLDRRGGPGR
jgi:short-subunit dehydrogenase